MNRFGAALLVALACACQARLDVPLALRHRPAEEPAQMDIRREYYDGGATPTRLKSEVEGLVARGGAFTKHGRDRSFFEDGSPRSERHWVRGEPAGTWRTWWPNGVLRSESSFPKDGAETAMRFWHDDGSLEAEGPAVRGRRGGEWRHFHRGGALESCGRYLDGERDGPWEFFGADGVRLFVAEYHRGVKVAAPVR